jgi:hypothetical protein
LLEGAVDAVLLGFQLLLWGIGLSENSLVERLLSMASKKRRERASISSSEEWVCNSGYIRMIILSLHSERFS